MVHVQGWLVTWKVIGDFYARMCDKCRNIIESSSMLIELLNSFTVCFSLPTLHIKCKSMFANNLLCGKHTSLRAPPGRIYREILNQKILHVMLPRKKSIGEKRTFLCALLIVGIMLQRISLRLCSIRMHL